MIVGIILVTLSRVTITLGEVEMDNGTHNLTVAEDLTGRMLIAMPGMSDDRFAGSVVFLCAHSGDGAMGLVINRPAPGVRLRDLFEQLSVEAEGDTGNSRVHAGGPVEDERGFVLHSSEYSSAISTLHVTSDIAMTATMDIMEDIACGRGPRRMMVALGYCGWGPGQLEREFVRNGWLICDSDPDLIFDCPNPEKWEAALHSIGVNPLTLSSVAGRA